MGIKKRECHPPYMTKRSKEIVYIAITANLLGEHNTSGKQKTTKKTTKKKKNEGKAMPCPAIPISFYSVFFFI